MKKIATRLLAVLLCLALLTASALALTPEQAAELLQTYYVDEIPAGVLDRPTVEEMLSALGDPYTQYFSAEEYAAFAESMQDTKIYGIGVTMQREAQGVLVTSVLEGYGAQKAGIQAGDYITAVDGHPVAGAELETVKGWISGAEGTTVPVTVLRSGESHTYSVVRAPIVVPATTTQLVDGHIGYVDCRTFGPETEAHFTEGFTTYGDKADRWIVDLRANGGGSIDAAVQTAGIFYGSGDLTYLRDHNGDYGAYRHEGKSEALGAAVVLVDGNTASASEIFASIIRDGQAGISVGSRTYGKGVAQMMRDRETDPTYFTQGDALKITSYRFFSPEGATNDKVGLIPELMVADEVAPQVAHLISASAPMGNTAGKLRMDMLWRFYVDLNVATQEANRPAFTALLEALPPDTGLWLGTGGPEGWRAVTPREVAGMHGLTGYAPRTFSDVAESPYAGEISLLRTYDIVSGPGDGTFRPQAEMTRGELCVMLAKALRYTAEKGSSHFADVPQGAYYAEAVEAMYARGLVNGYSDGLFHPEDTIDHQQFTAVMARVARALSMHYYDVQSDPALLSASPMLASWAPWAQESVWLLNGGYLEPMGQNVGVLWEKAESIVPTAGTTRGEAAAALCNLLITTQILPV